MSYLIMYYIWLLVVGYITLSSSEYGSANDEKCGYSSCDPGKPNVLNVHLIAHSHDDVGWLKTVDQYYYGSRDNIQGAGVQYIIDTVIGALDENANRKFSYVEMAYFTRWWKNQNEKTKRIVHSLVNEGRLQFLLGGWSMNDEADTHYTAIIDQMTLGLNFLNQTFGECGRPLVAWQIDPFGHSLEQSNLFSLMSFDANIFMRIDYRDKLQRIKEMRMEFIQNSSFFMSAKYNNLFTSILYDTYCPPSSFCFDDKCSDPPIMDDATLNDFNVNERVKAFAKYVISQSKAYNSNHILVPMGCDFQFQNAYHNFVNLDKLIYYVNRIRNDINVMYSTPACYIHAVNNAKKSYTHKSDDFFPYASGPNSFWTGYFTSRSALKGFIRESNNIYQTCKQIQVLSNSQRIDLNKKVKFMSMKMGVLQHHDAVTGTEKEQVAFDYAQRLFSGVSACEKVISSSISLMLSKRNKADFNFVLCTLSNISYCFPTDHLPYAPFSIVIYNSLMYTNTYWFRIPVHVASGDAYYVKDSKGYFVPSQLINITERTREIPERPKNSLSNYELIFNVNIKPLGYATYVILRQKSFTFPKIFSSEFSSVNKMKENDFVIKNKNLILTYKNNLLFSVFNVKSNINVDLNQSLKFYYSKANDGQNSGAYIFRPTTNEPLSFNDTMNVVVIKGMLLTEVYQTFSEWATLVTRLYIDSDKIETEWTVGPIPITNPISGREVIMHYSTNLETGNSFYTDSNSRQLIKRIINKRFDYVFQQTEPVSGNYYPINSDICIFDVKLSPSIGLLIQTDRAQGGGSYKDGIVEVMLHRRILFDDRFGVGEALNEIGSDGKGLIVRGKQWISVGIAEDVLNKRRIENVEIFNKPIALFNNGTYLTYRIKEFSALTMEIPKNLYLTSLENHFDFNDEVDYQIMRLENLDYSGTIPTNIDLNEIFNSLKIIQIDELNLSANQFLKNYKPLKWNSNIHNLKTQKNNGTMISLLPTEIRTFKVTFKCSL